MTELGAFLLPAVPLLALLVCLLLGRYPAARRSSASPSGSPPLPFAGAPAPVARRPPLRPRSFAPGGGLLIALSLAQRPPPLPA